jgi:hypothetical protein
MYDISAKSKQTLYRDSGNSFRFVSYLYPGHNQRHLVPKKVNNVFVVFKVSGAENKKRNSDNPYDLLDHFIEAAYKSVSADKKTAANPEQEIKMLKDEIALIHNQLLYERHRRETLGLRNRRLLGKTKSSRILEEEKRSVVSSL